MIQQVVFHARFALEFSGERPNWIEHLPLHHRTWGSILASQCRHSFAPGCGAGVPSERTTDGGVVFGSATRHTLEQKYKNGLPATLTL